MSEIVRELISGVAQENDVKKSRALKKAADERKLREGKENTINQLVR